MRSWPLSGHYVVWSVVTFSFVSPKQARPLGSSLRVVGSTVEFAQPREIVELPGSYATTPLRSYDSVDGRRFVYLHARALHTPLQPSPREMHVVLNWPEELKAKMPPNK